MIRLTLIAIACLLFATGVSAQTSGVEQVQAVIAGPLTGASARTLSDHLASRPGVLLCRVDPVSRN
ncbi:MAG TPA: hypothetical protein PK760_11900, partial [Flavobacteriales bacterium]|nr:hypothetical protein [Flavobacteriales bacterium]